MAAFVSDDPDALADPARRSRWSYFARADGERVVVPAGASQAEADRILRTALDQHTEAPRMPTQSEPADNEAPWFRGGWLAAMAYELGHSLEPASERACERDPARPEHRERTPRAMLLRCDAAYAHDGRTGRWWAVGAEEAIRRLPALPDLAGASAERGEWRLGRIRSRTGKDAYRRAVAEAVRAIHAGEVFQVNLAHALRASFQGDPRALFRAMLDAARPAFGAYIEASGRSRLACVLSVSPELFLRVEREGDERRVVTRPIKGTRPGVAGGAAELLHSRKDEAELAMITDLMRNDIGRVCRPGTVRVDEARGLEGCADGRVLHTASTVSGLLRATVSNTDLLRATFAPGSVTGAPKVRAMQMIRALEPRARGFYCGALGLFAMDGQACLSVAIRSATLIGRREGAPGLRGRLEFPVGAGVVAESLPEHEWRETLIKASVLRSLRGSRPREETAHA